MADLKTTQDRRERFVAWLHMPGEDRYSVRAWATAEDACDDVEVLLRENAKLRAVAEAARNLTNWDWMCMLDDNESPCTDDVRADVRKLESALAALEAP